jgi:hypothetical protein
MNTYLSYQATRMILYRDLGIVHFDERGMWVDEPLEAALKRVQGIDNCLPPAYPALASRNADLCSIEELEDNSGSAVPINLTSFVDQNDKSLVLTPTDPADPGGE